MSHPTQYGIDVLIREHSDWLAGRKVGLIAHPASVGRDGISSVQLLVKSGAQLACLFGPEHGFSGRGGAGEAVSSSVHLQLGIPIHSLYGEHRRPTRDMISTLDAIIFDLQDLGARPYTFVSTLRYVLEAAAENHKIVFIADRPAPLAGVVDGPMLDPSFESFVGMIRTPVVYGMTSGEVAQWLKKDLKLELDLRVAPVAGYQREAKPKMTWPEWIPPSPAILSWQCALCFPITVFLEALPALDHGRCTDTPFQRIGAPWLDGFALCRELRKLDLPGIRFTAISYRAMTGRYKGTLIKGITINVLDASRYLPVQTAVAMISAIQQLHGQEKLWQQTGTREQFFDQLMGTDTVRRAIKGGRTFVETTFIWALESADFRKSRMECLLY